jgi:hypothetical protein
VIATLRVAASGCPNSRFFAKFEELAFPNLQYVDLRTDNGELVGCGLGEEGNPRAPLCLSFLFGL